MVTIKRQLAAVEGKLEATTAPLEKLRLVQQQLDLQNELESRSSDTASSELEANFIAVASAYSERHGIGYRAFRQLGVPAATLKKAGVSR